MTMYGDRLFSRRYRLFLLGVILLTFAAGAGSFAAPGSSPDRSWDTPRELGQPQLWLTLFDQTKNMSVSEARELMDEHPDEPMRIFTTALVHLERGNEEMAEALIAKAFQLRLAELNDQEEPSGSVLDLVGITHEFAEVPIVLERLVTDYPDFVPAKLLLAFIRCQQGVCEEAIRLASESLDREPGNEVYRVRAHLLLAAGKSKLLATAPFFRKVSMSLSVRKHLGRARELAPENPRVLLAWGMYRLEAPGVLGGNEEEAERLLKQAVADHPHLVTGHALLAQLYKERGDTGSYRYYLARARELDPRNGIVQMLASAG